MANLVANSDTENLPYLRGFRKWPHPVLLGEYRLIQVNVAPGDRSRSYLEENECTSTVFIRVLISNFVKECLYPYLG